MTRFKYIITLFTLLWLSQSMVRGQEKFHYHWGQDDHLLVCGMVDQLTLEEKLQLISGVVLPDDDPSDGDYDNFGIRGIPGKGIPDLVMGHGITGVRAGRDLGVTSTYFGTPMAYSCSWDVDLYRRVGEAIALEMRALGQDLNLGPTVNIIRHPLGGRNWECLSEDPFLTSRFIVPFVHAMQTRGIICGPKHFVANNQDHNRFDINNVVDERTLREIYLPAFRASVVKGGALNIMGAYNRLNTIFMCHSRRMLTDVLRHEWGFKGFVISDANTALRSPLGGAYAGCDVDLKVDGKGPRVYADLLKEEVSAGNVPESMIDTMVYNVLKTMHLTGMFERAGTESQAIVHAAGHQAIASEVAVKSPVLLKNEGGLLPVGEGAYRRVAVIGPQAERYPGIIPGKGHYAYYLQGGGSGRTYYIPEAMIDPLTGIKTRFGGSSEITFAPGCLSPMEYRDNKPFEESAEEQKLVKEAKALARKSDLALLFVGLSGFNESEGWDRASAGLPGYQETLIREVAGVNRHTVVVLISGSYVDVSPWIDEVEVLLWVPYSGEKIGEGIAALLAGDASPSGKLSISWPFSLNDYPEGAILTGAGYSENGVNNDYSEGIYVGYRWFEKEMIKTRYPFGFGLSYCEFVYSGLEIESTGPFSARARFMVTNRGDREAEEVCQLYVSDNKCSADRPVKELKGFQRVSLAPGESRECTIELDRSAFSFFHPSRSEWTAEEGVFTLLVGSHSGSLPLQGDIQF